MSMSINDHNFIIGLISALALVVGIIHNLLSIEKLKSEIRGSRSSKRPKGGSNKNLATRSPVELQKISSRIGIVVDSFFFLMFSFGSITTILNYLANNVPVIAVAAQVLVAIYSVVLISDERLRSEGLSKNEQRYTLIAGWTGLLVSLSIFIMLGIQRLIPIFPTASTYNGIAEQLFSLAVNLAIVPLLAFTLISLHRIIRNISIFVISREEA